MSIDNKALPIWGWIAHHRESGGRPIIADPGRAAILPRTEGWDVFPVCRVDDAADRLAALEAENSRLQAGIQLYKAEFEHGLNGLKHEYAKLEQDNARLRGLLGAARCPNCDGSGVIPHGPTPDGDWDAEQCQWCYEKQEALAEGGGQ